MNESYATKIGHNVLSLLNIPSIPRKDIVRNCLHPRWLHVMRPRSISAKEGGNGWEGSLKSMKRHIGKVETSVAELIEKMDNNNNRVDAKMNHILRLLIASNGGGDQEEGRDKILRANRKLGMLRLAQSMKVFNKK